MRVALVGEATNLGAAVLRRLVVQRDIDELLWLDRRPPTVASPKLRWHKSETHAGHKVDALVWLAGQVPFQEDMAAQSHHLVIVLAAGREAPAGLVRLEALGVHVTCLRVGQVLGYAGPGPAPAGAKDLVWEEDVAEAIALALAIRPSGTFDLVAEAANGLDPARALTELGWKPRCADAASVAERWRTLNPVRLDPRIYWLLRTLDFAGRWQPAAHLAEPQNRVGLRLTGPDGGELGLIVRGVGMRVVFGPLPEPGTVVTMPAELLREMLTGKVSMPMAELTGRARIEGEFIGWLVVGTVCQLMQEGAAAKGPAGWLMRRYMAWLEQARRP